MSNISQSNSKRNFSEAFLDALRWNHMLGSAHRKAIVAWADTELAKAAHPASFLIELSTSCDLSDQEFQSLCNRFADNSTCLFSSRAALGILANRVHRGEIQLYAALPKILFSEPKLTLSECEAEYLRKLDWDYDNFVGVYGSFVPVAQAAQQFLDFYSGFRLDNFEEWARVNQELEGKLELLVYPNLKTQ